MPVRKASVRQEDRGVGGGGAGEEAAPGGAGSQQAVFVVLALLLAETPRQHSGTAGSLVGNVLCAQVRAIGMMEAHSEGICPPSLGWKCGRCWHSV